MACIYMLLLRDKSDGQRYYKIGYLNNGHAPDRMHYCNRDGSNVPLTTYFELVDHYEWETPRAKEVEQLLHHNIRNVWQWKCDGAKGIHRRHRYYPQLFSGVTEVRVEDLNEMRDVYRCIRSTVREI
jgi:hypothetical protein